jgi:phosphoribosylglycinamide formyltransferase-1
VRVAILVSGGGSNLGAILEAKSAGKLPHVEIVLVLSSRSDAHAIERARAHAIESVVVEPKQFPSDQAFQAAVLETLVKARLDIICLAGYVRKIGSTIVERFRGRILNIHPALLPKYGGPGMYSHFVHEAVLKAGEKESGCSVHLVDEEFDHGRVLAQTKVPVLPGDTPELLAARILEQEHLLYPKMLKEFSEKLIADGVKS